MLFNSIEFAIFLPIVYGLYLIMNHKGQNRMLLIASYVFYSFWSWKFLSLILISTLLDYICGLKIHHAQNESKRKLFLMISVIGNLTILFFFKYFNFFIDNLENIFHSFGWSWRWTFWKIILPIGISFYTFQTMSYTIDIYRKVVKPTKNFFDYALFVAFFPQLLAGPIERAKHLLPQIQKPRIISFKQFCAGCHLILWGLLLKVFVADNLAAIVDPIFSSSAPYDGAMVLLGTYAFAFQLYGDFAGYSFIAIGVARMMGIILVDNFKRPFFSEDITEFWRRWHISLTTWIFDYVLWPLMICFSRSVNSNVSYVLATMLTLVLFGFWHGADWTFGLFGIYFGILNCLYHHFKRLWHRLPIFVKMILTFHIMLPGFLMFRSSSLSQVFQMIYSLFFNFNMLSLTVIMPTSTVFIFYVWIVLAVDGYQWHKKDLDAILKLPILKKVCFYSICFFLLVRFGVHESTRYIYFVF